MKYLQIYEAFESNTISKIFKFLKSKNISNIKDFRDTLKVIQNNIEYPLDKIQDKDVKYLKKSKAIKIKSDKDVKNKYGIYCIKFWFSLDNGYLGHTATGDLIIDYENQNSQIFNKKDLNYITNNLGINTGTLTPVDYKKLKTGDKIIGFFSSYDDYDYLDIATIYKEGEYLYAIQNKYEGNSPDSYEWRKYGRYSWLLGRISKINTDHRKLNLYTENDEPIHCEKIKNDLDYNLPFNLYKFSLESWKEYTQYIINDLYFDEKKLSEADFAIILMLDNILKEEFKSVKQISSDRIETRKDALKLISDTDIKEININKYLTQIASKTVDMANFDKISNLKNLITNECCGKYILYHVMSTSTPFYNINKASNILFKFLNGEIYKKDIIRMLIDIYNTINKYRIDEINKFNASLKHLSDIKGDVKTAFDIYNNINIKLYDYVINKNIETLEDLRIVMFNILNIRNMIESTEFRIKSEFLDMITHLYQSDDMPYYIKNLENNVSLKTTIKGLTKIEKYVDNLLKSSI